VGHLLFKFESRQKRSVEHGLELQHEKRCTICYPTLHRLTNWLLSLLIPFSEGMVPITTTFSEHLTKVLRSRGFKYNPSLKFSKLSQTTNRWLEGLRFQPMMSSSTCNLKGTSTHTGHLALKQYFSRPRLLIYSYQSPPINMSANNKRSKLTNNKSFGPVNIFEHSRAGVKLCCDVRLCSGFHLSQHFEQKCWTPAILLTSLSCKLLVTFIQNMFCNVLVEML
jgi:hypothetical protein